ncbi:hypothetical protein AGMMS50268_29760 [Spirochaetia bacterium]|nr:hypothetical protein AGMMS50268_29760 [Spirochaetia bacterium]
MEIAKIYLETTMFSMYYAPDKPGYVELKAQVRQIFDQIKAGKFDAYTSIYTTDELDGEMNDEKREKMWQLITDFNVKMLPDDEAVIRLAGLYITEEAVPAAYTTDAAHIAITAFHGLDFIVSLNFEHIARPWTEERVRKVNIREGYKGIGIYRPVEVLDL